MLSSPLQDWCRVCIQHDCFVVLFPSKSRNVCIFLAKATLGPVCDDDRIIYNVHLPLNSVFDWFARACALWLPSWGCTEVEHLWGLLNASQATRITSFSFPQEPLTMHRHRRWAHISYDCKERKIIQIPEEICDMKTCPFSLPKLKQIDFSSQFDLGQHAKHYKCCWALKRDRFLRNEDMSNVNVPAGTPLSGPSWF